MDTKRTDADDVAVQPALPTLELPDFEGIRPVGVVTRLNGAGERIARAMHYDERVILVVEAQVSNVGHGKTAQGMKRVHTLSVLDLYELEGRSGRRIMNACRQAYRVADDARHGRSDLLGKWAGEAGYKMTPEGWTDASGNVLTEQDLADIRGTVIEKAANNPTQDTVALIFGDGSRALWPDDYPEADLGGDRPLAGEFFGDLQVRQVLDNYSGETLDEWTDAQEDERLKKLEEAALAEEARQDREAHDELLAARDKTRKTQAADSDEPFTNYEVLTAKEVRDAVHAMTDRDAVFAVAAWEEEHGGRKSIIEACGKRSAELLD